MNLFQDYSIKSRTTLLGFHIGSKILSIEFIRPLKEPDFPNDPISASNIIIELDNYPSLEIKAFLPSRTLLIQRHVKRDYYWNQRNYFTDFKNSKIPIHQLTDAHTEDYSISKSYLLSSNQHPYSMANPIGFAFEIANKFILSFQIDINNNPEEVQLGMHPATDFNLDNISISPLPQKTNEFSGILSSGFLANVDSLTRNGLIFSPDINFFKQRLAPLPTDPIPTKGTLNQLIEIRNQLMEENLNLIDIQLLETPEGSLKLIPPIELSQCHSTLMLDWINYLLSKMSEL